MADSEKKDHKEASLFVRFRVYQQERFSFLQNGLVITILTFSGIAYSYAIRGIIISGLPWLEFIISAITCLLFFFLLRIFDEFKDAEDDANYRPYRPVPRGLITLKELGWIGIFTILIQIFINAIFIPWKLVIYFIVLFFTGLMAKEFFVKNWLKKHMIIYMISHMLIMPLIALYITGTGWIVKYSNNYAGIFLFVGITFFNGMIFEFGRKIRNKESEETGVETYSTLLGEKKATYIWLIILLISFLLAVVSVVQIGYTQIGLFILLGLFIISSIPAIKFLNSPEQKNAKQIEMTSGIWNLLMYLTIGILSLISIL
jgi:4-hydroxybenzoate polyprenyltransferase